MNFDWVRSKQENDDNSYKRTIVFKERTQERILDASTDEILAFSCLNVLRDRYENPAWGYKPTYKDLTEEEAEFLEYIEHDYYLLPVLLQHLSMSIKKRIEARLDVSSDPDWTWYEAVQNLLALPPEQAVGYKIPYKGRYIPTSYYLLLQRRDHPYESFVIVDN